MIDCRLGNDNYFKVKFSTIAIFLLIIYPNMTGMSKYIYFGSSIVVASSLFLAIFCIYISNKKEISNYGLKFFYTELCWMLTALIMLVWNQDFKNGETGIIIQYILLVVFIIISKYSVNWIKAYNNYMISFAIIHATCTILFFIVPSLYPDIIVKLFDQQYQNSLLNWYNNGYATGLAVHYSQNGIFLAIATGVTFCILICNKNKRIKNIFAFAISFFALLLTGKRGPLLFSILAMMIFFFVFESNKPLSRFIKIASLILSGATLILILEKYVPAISNTLARFTAYSGDITNGRTELYDFAWLWFKENPIFGIGWGGYPYRVNTTFIGAIYGRDSNMYAHNVYLQLLCEVGIIGFIVFILPMLYTLLKTIKLLKESRYKKISINKEEEVAISISVFVQLYFLMYCITGNPLYDYSTLFPFMISCAVTGSIAFKKINLIKIRSH